MALTDTHTCIHAYTHTHTCLQGDFSDDGAHAQNLHFYKDKILAARLGVIGGLQHLDDDRTDGTSMVNAFLIKGLQVCACVAVCMHVRVDVCMWTTIGQMAHRWSMLFFTQGLQVCA
jgi:hypothetical protein